MIKWKKDLLLYDDQMGKRTFYYNDCGKKGPSTMMSIKWEKDILLYDDQVEKGHSTMMLFKWEKDILLYDDQMGKGHSIIMRIKWKRSTHVARPFSDHSSAAPFPDPENRSDRLGPAQAP
ncbi:hypothetical protein CEXT_131891 [Caerostris extrusa]|uniref:Uncharacterized protein n=1 Tax=Caerostris extrusa TaxID=172846 RepID=A0AAV4P2L8_CAEEX|nr:hypothetical protein CEXT_131891 [Caerostris extrusa]